MRKKCFRLSDETLMTNAHFLMISRAFNVAKEVMEQNKYVCDKKDHLINLRDNGKLQEVSNIDKRTRLKCASSLVSIFVYSANPYRITLLWGLAFIRLFISRIAVAVLYNMIFSFSSIKKIYCNDADKLYTHI